MEHLLDAGVHGGHSSPMFPTREKLSAMAGMTSERYLYRSGYDTTEKCTIMKRGTAAGDGCGDRQHAQTYGNTGGVNFVYNKQKDRVLRGPGLCLPCEILGTCKGQHRYPRCQLEKRVRRGHLPDCRFHGCINTPKDKMEELFDMVQIGTPVVMFY